MWEHPSNQSASLRQGGQRCCFLRLVLRFYVERVFGSYTSSQPQDRPSLSSLANTFIIIRKQIHKCVSHLQSDRWKKKRNMFNELWRWRRILMFSTVSAKRRHRKRSTLCMMHSTRYVHTTVTETKCNAESRQQGALQSAHVQNKRQISFNEWKYEWLLHPSLLVICSWKELF